MNRCGHAVNVTRYICTSTLYKLSFYLMKYVPLSLCIIIHNKNGLQPLVNVLYNMFSMLWITITHYTTVTVTSL